MPRSLRPGGGTAPKRPAPAPGAKKSGETSTAADGGGEATARAAPAAAVRARSHRWATEGAARTGAGDAPPAASPGRPGLAALVTPATGGAPAADLDLELFEENAWVDGTLGFADYRPGCFGGCFGDYCDESGGGGSEPRPDAEEIL